MDDLIICIQSVFFVKRAEAEKMISDRAIKDEIDKRTAALRILQEG